MIVYGHRSFDLGPERFLLDLRARFASAGARPPHDVLVEWLVDIGEAEAAVGDALMRDNDVDAPELCGWRTLAGAIAEAVCASHYDDGDAVLSAVERAQRAVECVLVRPSPAVVRARLAEGFACYALYPEQYMSAADQLAAHMRPPAVFCLGLRSIGGILAHVVGATLRRRGVSCVIRTARPRGHPFDRYLQLDRSLSELIQNCGCDVYAVIDEGPGLSGSSFAAAAEQLLALGVAPERIVLMPAWDADPDRLKSRRGARTWGRHRRFVGHYDCFHGERPSIDFSAGRWRSRVFCGDEARWPAVQPQHERPKFLDGSFRRISRFAGLGRTGTRRRTRAESLHEYRFGPAACGLRRGVLELEWLDGRPLRSVSTTFLNEAARYVSVIAERFATGQCDDIDELREMIQTNAGEGGIAVALEPLAPCGLAASTQRVAVDGRMMPHEWIETASGFRKIDALDHHDDDFFPGCRDIAWDVAGVCVECDLDREASTYFVGRYRSLARDVGITHRLPFYQAAYAAYRLGYARMAAESVADAAEVRRFRRLEQMYADRLRRFERSA